MNKRTFLFVWLTVAFVICQVALPSRVSATTWKQEVTRFKTRWGNPEDISILNKLVNQGNLEAKFFLGHAMIKQKGRSDLVSRGEQLIFQSAEGGFAMAQFFLGLMYKDGHSGIQNQALAVHWFSKAADQGFAEAKTCLADALASGVGIPQDLTRSRKLFEEALKDGDTVAADGLQRMSKILAAQAVAAPAKGGARFVNVAPGGGPSVPEVLLKDQGGHVGTVYHATPRPADAAKQPTPQTPHAMLMAMVQNGQDMSVTGFWSEPTQQLTEEIFKSPANLIAFLEQAYRKTPNNAALLAAYAPRTPEFDAALIEWILGNQRLVSPPFFHVLAGRYGNSNPSEASRWFFTGKALNYYESKLCGDTSASAGCAYSHRLVGAGLDAASVAALEKNLVKRNHCDGGMSDIRALIRERSNAVPPEWICRHGMNAFSGKLTIIPRSAWPVVADETIKQLLDAVCNKPKSKAN
ncbi:MAG: tetratricopeptide repeat protein [Humidesulfovibrio sp.]|nr:tetratricopeptide repeat protein [Humidesulfovibrio sp.]